MQKIKKEQVKSFYIKNINNSFIIICHYCFRKGGDNKMIMRSTHKMSKSDINKLQEKIDFTFPDEYINDMLSFGAAQFEETVINVPKKDAVYLKSFLNLKRGERESVYVAICSTGRELIPFAFTDCGCLICFNREDKSIIEYNKQLKAKTEIAESYEQFRMKIFN